MPYGNYALNLDILIIYDDDQTMGRHSVKNEEQLQLYIAWETTSVAKIQARLYCRGIEWSWSVLQ